jgi:predicted enzyme related to lactoylglutathione lyase/uncharacterized glyoxalase superfamily protein PhnB
MTFNRSVPVDTVLPHVIYQDVAEAIDWLSKTFGFAEHYRYGDPEAISGAQIHLGKACIQLKRARDSWSSPTQLGGGTQSLTVFVDDVDGHYERTKSTGAKIVEELHETVYGERQYGVEDLAGHHWLFSKHVQDFDPKEWGAVVSGGAQSQPASVPLDELPRPRLCYMEVPAVDVHESASFFEKIFGWDIRHRDTNRPSFDDASGVSGAWVTGRPISREPGLLPYIWVDDIEAMLRKVTENGGAVVESSHPDHPGSASHIATFRDPAGNLIGLYQEAGN